jgi:hypothetical protein
MMASGKNRNQIARESGVDNAIVYRLLPEDPAVEGLSFLLSDNAARLMKVRAGGDGLRPDCEPAYDTRMRIQGLMLQQWDYEAISAGSGVSSVQVGRMCRGATEVVRRRNASAIREFHDASINEMGPAPNAANLAGRVGYLPSWRTLNEPVPNQPRLLPRIALGLEAGLEAVVAEWLRQEVVKPTWAELMPERRRLLELRFLGETVMKPQEVASRVRRKPWQIRVLTRQALWALLKDPRTAVGDFKQELRVYMTHDDLRQLEL